METWKIAFASVAIVLQAINGVYSSLNDWPDMGKWNEMNTNQPGILIPKDGMKVGGVVIKPMSYDQLDDVYESQIPPPPTQGDLEAGHLPNELIDNIIRRLSTENAGPLSVSGAGHLESNEILKHPHVLVDNTSNNNNKVEDQKQPLSSATQSYDSPELNEAVRKAVDKLPADNESPLVRLIKIVNERVQQQSSNGSENSEDLLRKNLIQKHVILKLAKHVEDAMKEKEVQLKEEVEPCMNDQVKEDKSSITTTQNQEDENVESCSCEETDPENMSHSLTRNQENGFTIEDNQISGMKNPKLLAHIIIFLKKRSPGKLSDTESNPQINFAPINVEDNTPFKSQKFPQLSRVLLKVAVTKSTIKNIPPPSFDNNDSKEFSNRQAPMSLSDIFTRKEQASGDVIPISRERLVIGMATGECRGGNDSSEENDQPSLSTILSDGQNDREQSIPDIQRLQFGQTKPKEFLFLKHLNDIVKEKAAADAMRRRQLSDGSEYFPSPEVNSNIPSLVPSKVMFLIPRKPIATQLPPLKFPNGNSEFKVRRIDDSKLFQNVMQTNIDDSESESQINLLPGLNNHIRQGFKFEDIDNGSIDNNLQKGPELLDFIKQLAASQNNLPIEDRFQPIPSQTTPPQKNAEEINPIFFRAALAPFAF